jgi:hypothetical protein
MGMLYDESDEIASDHPSEAWQKKAVAEGVEGTGYRPFTATFIWSICNNHRHS